MGHSVLMTYSNIVSCVFCDVFPSCHDVLSVILFLFHRTYCKCCLVSDYVLGLYCPNTIVTGPNSESTMRFLYDLGITITSVSDNDTEVHFLFQRLSVALQRFRTILLHESFGSDHDQDL